MGAKTTPTRILFVEDDPLLRRAVRRRLTIEGFDVLSTACGLDALQAAIANGPLDAGIFDIDLPDVSGGDLARHLLGLKLVGRAVFFTSSTERVERARARAQGPVIDKDSGIDKLLAALRNIPEEKP